MHELGRLIEKDPNDREKAETGYIASLSVMNSLNKEVLLAYLEIETSSKHKIYSTLTQCAL